VWNAIETLNRDYKTAKEIMIPEKDIYWAQESDSIEKVGKYMHNHDYSQVPVGNKQDVTGAITQQTVMKTDSEDLVDEVKIPSFPEVRPDTKIHIVKSYLAERNAVLVVDDEEVIGLITPFDVMKYMHDIEEEEKEV